MGLLKYPVLLLCLTAFFQTSSAQTRPFIDYDYSGIIQGRGAFFLFNTDKPTGPLDTFFPGTGSGGIYETSALISKCEFKLKTPFYLSNSTIVVTAKIGGYKATVKEAYLHYQINSVWALQAGLVPTPFGSELQQSSSKLDTIERSLIYGFGNYGWIDSIGFEVLNDRDYGIRSEWYWSEGFAGIKPFFETALVTGSGKNIRPSTPLQWIGRMGISSALEFEAFKHELVLGISGSHGWVKTDTIQSTYIPVGETGDIITHPQNAITETAFDAHEHVSILGVDAIIRMNDLVIKGEWMIHRLEHLFTEGYYVTARFELAPYIQTNLNIVAKWEELETGYATGVHKPGTPYQAATLGLNWMLSNEWKWQLHYTALLKNKELHLFYGSDLLLTQLQFTF